MAYWAFTLLHCNEESFEEVYKSGFKTREASSRRKTRLMSKLWEVLQAYGRKLTHQADGCDVLIVKDWEEHFFSDKDVMMGKLSRQTDFTWHARENTYVCERERIREH